MNNNSNTDLTDKSLEKKFSELKEGKEIINDLSDNSNKVRRNLIFFSTVGIFLKLSNADLSGNINIAGLIINNLDDYKILIGLYIIITYHVCHFTCIAYEKITDIESDKKRSKAYEGFRKLTEISSQQKAINFTDHFKKQIDSLQSHMAVEGDYSKLTPRLRKKISKEDYEEIIIKTSQQQLNIFVEKVKCAFRDLYISEALYMANQGFQSVRWYILEIGFPIILGLFAIFCLLADYSL